MSDQAHDPRPPRSGHGPYDTRDPYGLRAARSDHGPYDRHLQGPDDDPHDRSGHGPDDDPYASRPVVHEEAVDGFGTVRVLPLDACADAAVVHGWVSGERASFWGMNGLTTDQVAGIYDHLAGLDTHHAYLLVKDGGRPVALLQTYDPRADRVGECYDVRPGDIGVHLLLAPAGPDGARPGWTAALARVVLTYLMDGLGVRRVVVDPDVRNDKAVARFVRQGFTPGPEVLLPEVDLPDVYLPEKRARLAFLTREAAGRAGGGR